MKISGFSAGVALKQGLGIHPISLDVAGFSDDNKVETKNCFDLMKTRISTISLLVSLGIAALLPQPLSAQEASVTVSAPPTAAAAAVLDPAKLPYGVGDVVKLARAQVSEDVIITYVQNSGTAYNLSPNEIVYLRDQGVSDHVINIMLDQRRNLAASVTQTPPAAPAPAPAYPDAASAGGYAQTAPNVPSSSLYVIPYSPSYPGYSYYDSYPYYYSYPYYGGYYGYGGPSFVFSFGHGFSHGFHGGFHGGGFHGGGSHGGGGHMGHGGSGHSGHH